MTLTMKLFRRVLAPLTALCAVLAAPSAWALGERQFVRFDANAQAVVLADQGRYLVALPDPSPLITKAQESGLHASVVGRAGGKDFASGSEAGDLFRIPLEHLREWHEGWLPNWIEG